MLVLFIDKTSCEAGTSLLSSVRVLPINKGFHEVKTSPQTVFLFLNVPIIYQKITSSLFIGKSYPFFFIPISTNEK